jgi:hypothetical protein
VNVRHWTIASQYSERFLEASKKEAFAVTSKSPMSPEDLLRLKEQQSLLGEQAEEWALSYEKQRLAKHPLTISASRHTSFSFLISSISRQTLLMIAQTCFLLSNPARTSTGSPT